MRINQVEPPKDLLGSILSKIEFQEAKTAKNKSLFFGVISLFSTIALIPAIQFTIQEFSQSAFYSYLSLAISDGDMIIKYWKEFSLSLAESAPLLGITITLAIILALLGSLKLTISSFRYSHKLQTI
jgi:hypothetical protein